MRIFTTPIYFPYDTLIAERKKIIVKLQAQWTPFLALLLWPFISKVLNKIYKIYMIYKIY